MVPRTVAGRLSKERLGVSEITPANFSCAKDAQYRMRLFWGEENGGMNSFGSMNYKGWMGAACTKKDLGVSRRVWR